MTLARITDRDAWEAFQTSRAYAQFLQSWDWGEFRASEGSSVARYALRREDGAWSAAIQLEYRRRRFGQGYWFAPRGPVFAPDVPEEERRNALMALCDALVREPDLRRRTLFWRFEPASELGRPEGLVPLSFRRTFALNPASTILLDLEPSAEDLLAAMHEKTRYNIRVSERYGVNVRIGRTDADLAAFLDLMDETARRDGFVQHARDYLAATYRALDASRMARLRFAEIDGRLLAANLEIAYGDTVTYLYGASSSEHRNVMAPYALHWQAIREAKLTGRRFYDFWGVNPVSRASFYYKPSWEGISRFKRGWGGKQIDLVGTWDLPFNVYLYRLVFLKQFFRG